MEFSSDVLIDFGLNLAGYVVVALLVYVLIARRIVAIGPAAGEGAAGIAGSPKESTTATLSDVKPAATPEFVSLLLPEKTHSPRGCDRDAVQTETDENRDATGTEWRRQNRRAIYEEARRLLAHGSSRTDLLSKLPVTESELDMLTVTGRA